MKRELNREQRKGRNLNRKIAKRKKKTYARQKKPENVNIFQEAFLLYDQRGDGKIPVSQIGKDNRLKS